MSAYRVAYRAVEKPRILLEDRQTDAAIQIGREVHGAPVVSKAYSDRTFLIEADEIVSIVGNALQSVRIDDNAGNDRDAGADRPHTPGRCRFDKIGVVYSGGIDMSIVGLQPQAAPESRQEVKEGLIGN